MVMSLRKQFRERLIGLCSAFGHVCLGLIVLVKLTTHSALLQAACAIITIITYTNNCNNNYYYLY